jgi:hypothetical protein
VSVSPIDSRPWETTNIPVRVVSDTEVTKFEWLRDVWIKSGGLGAAPPRF